jgi:hypothetical protein
MRLRTRITAIAFTAVAALGTSAYALGGTTPSKGNIVDVTESTLLPVQDTGPAPDSGSTYRDRDCPERDGGGASGGSSDGTAPAPDQAGADNVGAQL